MEKVKYILIVSQYYYSHHCFVVSAEEENFREKALTLIEKLEDYKRGERREYNYGYPRETAYTDIAVRWNVNDTGDIYFIPCETVTDAIEEASEYDTYRRYERHFKKLPKDRRGKMELAVAAHHNAGKVKNIVGSVFEIS